MFAEKTQGAKGFNLREAARILRPDLLDKFPPDTPPKKTEPEVHRPNWHMDAELERLLMGREN